MSQKKESLLAIQEYYSWVGSQKFKNSEEHHRYISLQEQNFLQHVIYPMFYSPDKKFKTPIPFPMVLRDFTSKMPIYVIDNDFFTIVFCSINYLNRTSSWEVSVHIKDNSFCDEKIIAFAKWFKRHYIPDPRLYFVNMTKMPSEFQYPKINPYLDLKKATDFSIEFWNYEKDFLLFKLCDQLRLF